MEKILASRSFGQRIQMMQSYVSERLAAVCQQFNLPVSSIEVVGTSDAIIRAAPEKLRQLITENGPLAKAEDLMVRANEFMPMMLPL